MINFIKVNWHCLWRIFKADEHVFCEYQKTGERPEYFCLCGYESKTPRALEIVRNMRQEDADE